MPEMPEVRTVSSDMNKIIKNKTIKSVLVLKPKILKDINEEQFKKIMVNQTIDKVTNIGKWIVCYFQSDVIWLSHLRMTGRYNFFKQETKRDKHVYVTLTFTDGTELHFEDPRGFAVMHIKNKENINKTKPIMLLAKEPRNEDPLTFYNRIHKSGRPIKVLIMDQTIILGYGNIYVDETLWLNKIHPNTKGKQITKEEAKNILSVGAEIMDKSTQLGGSSIQTYGSVNGKPGRYAAHLKVFRKNGLPCLRCKTTIQKIRVGGRGTHFCPKCQIIKNN